MFNRGWITAVGACTLLCVLPGIAAASPPAWTTYRHDAARSGIDPDSTSPLATPSQIWQSAALDGQVYGEPLVYGSRVYVATENDTVYALDAATGAIVWQTHLATPVPGTNPPLCGGDITPTVGVTSTPVIDPSTGRIYVVADTWDGSSSSSIGREMFALNLVDGSVAVGPVSVEPPGDTPTDQLQRASLALNDGKVIIGYGGNASDCGTYHGWLVAVREDGTGSLQTYEVDSQPGDSQGAIWAAGNAPAIDSSGDIWTATGNGSSTNFDFQESVTKLDPNLNRLDWWAPSNWATLDSTDKDLGSSMPMLLPDGLVFQVGKAGTGYLLDASNLGQTDTGSPVFSGTVCPASGTTLNGSRGGGVYYNGVIYVTCTNGVFALSLDTTSNPPSFAPLSGWTVPPNAIGPPVEAGGRIWVASYRTTYPNLVGLDPQTGATGQLTFNLTGFEHFETPGAGGGRLFVANQTGTGVDQVTALQIADPPQPAATSSALSSSANPTSVGQSVTFTATVSPAPAPDAGTVAFTDGGTPIAGCGAVPVSVPTGEATCTTTFSRPGSHAILASYSGNAYYTGSSGSLSQRVTSPTSVTVSSSASPASAGQSVTFTSTVNPAPDGGTVAFTDGGTPITGCDAAPVNVSTGKATCTTSFSNSGRHSIVASYSGDAYYLASSGSLNQDVSPVISQLHVRVIGGKLRLSLTLSGPAQLKVIVWRLVPGRLVHGRCRAGAKQGRRCRASLRTRMLRLGGNSGRDVLVPKMRALPPGTYLVTVIALGAGGRSKTHKVLVVVPSAQRATPHHLAPDLLRFPLDLLHLALHPFS